MVNQAKNKAADIGTGDAKRFVRYKEGAALYSISQNKFEELAKRAKAVYKIDKLVLVNMDILDAYLEMFQMN